MDVRTVIGKAWTPGPWRIVDGGIDARYLTGIGEVRLIRRSEKGDDRYVAVATIDAMGSDYHIATTAAEQQANANLIAAAPDLYDALFGMLSLIITEGYRPGLGEKPVLKDGVRDQKIAEARAAIAKAEGQSSHPDQGDGK